MDVRGEDVQLAAPVAGGVELARGEGVRGEGGGVGVYGGVFVEEGGEEGGCDCGGVVGQTGGVGKREVVGLEGADFAIVGDKEGEDVREGGVGGEEVPVGGGGAEVERRWQCLHLCGCITVFLVQSPPGLPDLRHFLRSGDILQHQSERILRIPKETKTIPQDNYLPHPS